MSKASAVKTAPARRVPKKAPTVAKVTDSEGNVGDEVYRRFLEGIQYRFLAILETGPLFTADAEGLWDAYLGAFPVKERQYHTCSACRRFIETYGALVVIDGDGMTVPATLSQDNATGEEGSAIAAMLKIVRRAKVTGPFLSKETTWGLPVTGIWRHMAVMPPSSIVYAERALTAGQAMAEKREDFNNVSRALAEYHAPAVYQALATLKSDALFRAEKVIGPCQFLADLHDAIKAHPNRRENKIWRAVATAPAGFCHPRSSMVGTLLDDIMAGVDFDEAARRFREKMHPLQYQRPQAAPSAGNIAAAEKLVEKLGIAPSLVRRFARLDEIETIWTPAPSDAPKDTGGVFGHLKAKGEISPPSMSAPPQTMTWVKFVRDFLPEARTLELFAPYAGNYMAILTANDSEAPPILQWDLPERRNPFSTYVYHGGSLATQWAIVGQAWVTVAAVTQQPPQWFGGNFPHQNVGAVIVVKGAKDTRTGQGNALFPETLKSDLHAVRATIEAYSRTATIQGLEEASACGLSIGQGRAADCRLLVTDRHGIKTEFRIDRFE